jgi:nucleoid-associated protein YgaU
MPVDPLSRYRNLPALQVVHATRGTTRSLAIRRSPLPPAPASSRTHRFTSYDTVDLLAHKFFGHEELYWAILDYNGQRSPDEFQPGDQLTIPPLAQVTRVQRPT